MWYIGIEIRELQDELLITVYNPSEMLSEETIIEMFKMGYTTKVNGGIGLNKLRDFEKKYNMQISVENKIESNCNRVYFIIKINSNKKIDSDTTIISRIRVYFALQILNLMFLSQEEIK